MRSPAHPNKCSRSAATSGLTNSVRHANQIRQPEGATVLCDSHAPEPCESRELCGGTAYRCVDGRINVIALGHASRRAVCSEELEWPE